jgi:hypothetical protein
VVINIISFQLKFIESIIALTAALEKICGRPPASAFPTAWIHQIHDAGEVSGSTTMVMLFVM